MSLTIREFNEEDLADCIHLGREMVDHHRAIYEDENIPYGDEELKEKLLRRDENWLKFVAVENNSIVGLLILEIRKAACEVDYIVVAKGKRGRGVGKTLMNKAKEIAIKKGCREIMAKVAARNVEAIKFYNKNGLNCLGMIEVFTPLSREGEEQWYKRGKKTVFLGFECYY